MAASFPSVPAIPTFEPGDTFRLRVTGAPDCALADAVARGLVAGGFAEIVTGPVTARKGTTCGSRAAMRAVKRFGTPQLRAYANLIGFLDPPAKVFVDGESSSVPATVLDALTLGPARRAVQSGIDRARQAPADALETAREFAAGAGESIAGVTTPISIAAAVIAIAIVVLVLLYLFKR